MRANLWKSTSGKDHSRIVDLRKTIATKLLERDPQGFVVFHFDGDRPWKDRGDCPHHEPFQRLIVARVRTLIAERLGESNPDAPAVHAAISRLLPVVPHYSVEAWLYQNTDEAIRACASEERCGKHVELFRSWQSDRSLLDEIPKPKDQTCLQDKHNRRLASSAFPASQVRAASKSFADAVDNLAACHCLVKCLCATRA